MNFLYIDLDMVRQIHGNTIKVSGGGACGEINLQTLEGVLQNIQNDDYYPRFEDKLTHLVFCANRFHCFQDGNKRISIALGIQFLNLNGYLYCMQRFLQEMENISYHLAAGRISKELLHRIIDSILNETDFPEALKLDILHCISD